MDNISKKLSNDELSKVNEFSKRFYRDIIGRHPEWDKYAKVENWGWLTFVLIEISPPVQEVFSILIAASEEEEEEISVHFGPTDSHMNLVSPKGKKPLTKQLDIVEKTVEEIINEELIAVQFRMLKLLVFDGMISLKKYKKLLKKGKVRRAVSWKGTYNYPKYGAHLNWYP